MSLFCVYMCSLLLVRTQLSLSIHPSTDPPRFCPFVDEWLSKWVLPVFKSAIPFLRYRALWTWGRFANHGFGEDSKMDATRAQHLCQVQGMLVAVAKGCQPICNRHVHVYALEWCMYSRASICARLLASVNVFMFDGPLWIYKLNHRKRYAII